MPLYVDDAIVEQPVDHRTLHARYAAFARQLLLTAAATTPRRPFFLYLAYSHLHTPIIYDFARYEHANASSARGHAPPSRPAC